MEVLDKIRRYIRLIKALDNRLYKIGKAIGRVELKLSQQDVSENINDHEFQVFSKAGEDGIIQYLIRKVPIENEIFVEFGVENYRESNTRFLLENNNWSGLVVDSSEKYISDIKKDSIYWEYDLKAVCEFINRDNINCILTKNGISGDIGLLSIDIDGNDYWVWENIKSVNPRIVICEYNHIFGPSVRVVVPYAPYFNRTEAHFSNLYFGASIAALEELAKRKGYSLVASNSNSHNAFFVRNDVIGKLQVKTAKEAYVEAKFRESRDTHGKLTFLDFNERINLISAMVVYDLDSERNVKIGDLW